jgi:dTDP-4-amino-4,6-dideoxygalactose transaminase
VLFQHTYGSSAGLDEIGGWTQSRGMLLVEDRAQCLPLRDAGASGRRGRASIFSNNLLKPLPAGSGGFAVTDDAAFATAIEAARRDYPAPSPTADVRLRLSALAHDYVLNPRTYWPMLSLFERIDGSYRAQALEQEIAAEIQSEARLPSAYQLHRGLASLSTLEACAIHRRRCTAEYARATAGMPGVTVPGVDRLLPLYYFPVMVANKQTLLDRARRSSIELIAWPRSTPIYPIDDRARLSQYGYTPGSCPVAESVASRLVGLPTHPKVTASHRTRILDLLQQAAA